MKSFEEFSEKEAREGSWGVKDAVADADFVVENTGTLQEFQKKIRELVEKILKGESSIECFCRVIISLRLRLPGKSVGWRLAYMI